MTEDIKPAELSITINTILNDLLSSDKVFTDIRFESEGPVMIKTVTGWVNSGIATIPSFSDIGDFLNSVDSNWLELINKGSLNRPLDVPKWRFRINAYLAFAGTKLMLSVRKIPLQAPSIQMVGLPSTVRILLENKSGLIIVSGPTGSGKTSSVAAMIDAINSTRSAHILTIEDPIEFLYASKQAVFSQREVGVDCSSFSEAVRDALRQRPDVIVIGEIRDKETAEQALVAGESGHLVIGTLHSSSAANTVGKLLGFFNDDERESKLRAVQNSLIAIVNQTLITRKDQNGLVLAVDFLANNKGHYSKIINDADKVAQTMERGDDGDISISLARSVTDLINNSLVDKVDAAKAVSGNAMVYEKIRKL